MMQISDKVLKKQILAQVRDILGVPILEGRLARGEVTADEVAAAKAGDLLQITDRALDSLESVEAVEAFIAAIETGGDPTGQDKKLNPGGAAKIKTYYTEYGGKEKLQAKLDALKSGEEPEEETEQEPEKEDEFSKLTSAGQTEYYKAELQKTLDALLGAMAKDSKLGQYAKLTTNPAIVKVHEKLQFELTGPFKDALEALSTPEAAVAGEKVPFRPQMDISQVAEGLNEVNLKKAAQKAGITVATLMTLLGSLGINPDAAEARGFDHPMSQVDWRGAGPIGSMLGTSDLTQKAAATAKPEAKQDWKKLKADFIKKHKISKFVLDGTIKYDMGAEKSFFYASKGMQKSHGTPAKIDITSAGRSDRDHDAIEYLVLKATFLPLTSGYGVPGP